MKCIVHLSSLFAICMSLIIKVVVMWSPNKVMDVSSLYSYNLLSVNGIARNIYDEHYYCKYNCSVFTDCPYCWFCLYFAY